MLEFRPALSDSAASIHEDHRYDLEYDVYIFWPSQGGLELPPGQDFVHSRVPYDISLRGSEHRSCSAILQFPPSSSSSHSQTNTATNHRLDSGSISAGCRNIFGFSFFTSINHKLERLVCKIRRGTERTPAASV